MPADTCTHRKPGFFPALSAASAPLSWDANEFLSSSAISDPSSRFSRHSVLSDKDRFVPQDTPRSVMLSRDPARSLRGRLIGVLSPLRENLASPLFWSDDVRANRELDASHVGVAGPLKDAVVEALDVEDAREGARELLRLGSIVGGCVSKERFVSKAMYWRWLGSSRCCWETIMANTSSGRGPLIVTHDEGASFVRSIVGP